jgi:hypothetical protein
MTAYDLLQAIAQDIQRNWAGSNRAVVKVAEDPVHALDMIVAGAAGYCLVVLFYVSDTGGDDGYGDTATDAQIRIALTQPAGQLRKRDGAAPPPVLRTQGRLRKWLGGRYYDGILEGLIYRGMQYIPTSDGKAHNGYAMTYGVNYAHDVDIDEES